MRNYCYSNTKTLFKNLFKSNFNWIIKYLKMKMNEVSNKQCRINYFLDQIEGIYKIVTEGGFESKDLKNNIIIQRSLICYFIVCIYGLFEIIYPDFRRLKQFYNLRQKLVHGDAVFPNKRGKKQNISSYNITPLPRIKRNKAKIFFSLIWQAKKEDEEIAYIINGEEKYSLLDEDGANHHFPGEVHKELESLLGEDFVYICKSGSFICDLEKIYDLVQARVTEYNKQKQSDHTN